MHACARTHGAGIQQCIDCGDDDTAMHSFEMLIEAVDSNYAVLEASLPSLATVAMSGLMAEADEYGKALGANADLKMLNGMLLCARPPISAQKQQDVTRYAALMAWSILQKHERALEAIAAALEEGVARR